MNDKTAPKRPSLTEKSLSPPPSKSKYTWLLLLVMLTWSAYKTDASLVQLLRGFPEMSKILIEMVPPDWSYLDTVWSPMMDTVKMAVLGTTIGGIAAIPVVLLAAGNVTRSVWLRQPARIILNLIRTIPELLFAALFVAIFGIGSMPGVLALACFSFGIIAKLAYEAVEAIDPGPLEAMTAAGANKLQWIGFGVVPQVLAPFATYVLYTFEVNVRAAAVLGFVGAGGIGLVLDRTLNQLRYDRSALIILLTLAIVLVIDYVSTKAREKLL